MTLTQIITVISTYLLSLGIYYATNQKILNLITKDGYTVKDGDLPNLWNELNIPNTNLTKIMSFFPFLNVIAASIEGIINLKTYNDIFEDLKQKNIIVQLNTEEKQYFKLKEETFKASTEITKSIERKDNIVNPLYLQLFYLEDEIDNESLKTIIYSANKIINNEKLNLLEKEDYLNQICSAIYTYLRELSKSERKHMNLKINLDIDNNNIENSDFTIKKEHKPKTKTKEHH